MQLVGLKFMVFYQGKIKNYPELILIFPFQPYQERYSILELSDLTLPLNKVDQKRNHSHRIIHQYF